MYRDGRLEKSNCTDPNLLEKAKGKTKRDIAISQYIDLHKGFLYNFIDSFYEII